MRTKKSQSEPKPMTYNKPGGEGTVIIRGGCPGCGMISGHTASCPSTGKPSRTTWEIMKAEQERIAGG